MVFGWAVPDAIIGRSTWAVIDRPPRAGRRDYVVPIWAFVNKGRRTSRGRLEGRQVSCAGAVGAASADERSYLAARWVTKAIAPMDAGLVSIVAKVAIVCIRNNVVCCIAGVAGPVVAARASGVRCGRCRYGECQRGRQCDGSSDSDNQLLHEPFHSVVVGVERYG
jgi:hypothetical protein